MRRLIGACLVLASCAVGADARADAVCTQEGNLVCQTSAASSSISILMSPRGDVSIVRDTGLIKPTTDQALRIGDRILLGRGSAIVSLAPTCNVTLPDNASLSIVTSGGNTCVQLDDQKLGAVAPPSPPSTSSVSAGQVAATVAVAGAMGAGAYYYITQTEKQQTLSP